MVRTQSKITSRCRTTIPREVRRRLGILPGSTLEWEEVDGKITVRRVGKYTLEDVRRALFGNRKPKRQTLAELKEGVGQYIDERHAAGRY